MRIFLSEINSIDGTTDEQPEKERDEANARADAAEEWERALRQADDKLDKLGAPVAAENGARLNFAGRIELLFRNAEARVADLAKELERIANAKRRDFQTDKEFASWAQMRAQAALNPEAREEETRPPAIFKVLTNQHGQAFAVYLSDGKKIGIQREGGAAWLRIEDTPIVQAAMRRSEGGGE
jgi:hypothetical protein